MDQWDGPHSIRLPRRVDEAPDIEGRPVCIQGCNLTPTLWEKLGRPLDRKRAISILMKKNWSTRRIGEALGVSHKTVSLDIKEILAEWREEQKDYLHNAVTFHLKRLETMLEGVWDMALGDGDRPPDLFAVDRVLKIMERQARILGIDAPTKVANTDAEGNSVLPHNERAQRLASILNGVRARQLPPTTITEVNPDDLVDADA